MLDVWKNKTNDVDSGSSAMPCYCTEMFFSWQWRLVSANVVKDYSCSEWKLILGSPKIATHLASCQSAWKLSCISPTTHSHFLRTHLLGTQCERDTIMLCSGGAIWMANNISCFTALYLCWSLRFLAYDFSYNSCVIKSIAWVTAEGLLIKILIT